MMKWLVVSAVLVNVLAFYSLQHGFSVSQSPVPAMVENQLRDDVAGGVVLLAELKRLPIARQSVVEVVALEQVGSSVVGLPGQAVDKGENELFVNEALGKIEFAPPLEVSEALVERSLVIDDGLPEAGGSADEGLGVEESLACIELGRFDKKSDASVLLSKLRASVGIEADLKEVSEGLERFLVFMPPFETQEAAKQQQAALFEKGISSSLYYKGELKNGLSLGYFGSSENANRKYQRLLAKGYEVKLRPIMAKVLRYSLELYADESDQLSELFWQDLAREHPNVGVSSVTCAGVRMRGATNKD